MPSPIEKRQNAQIPGQALMYMLCFFNAITLAQAQSVVADMVCSATGGCIAGKVAAKTGVQITLPAVANSTLPSTALLLPGTYSSALEATPSNNNTLLSRFLMSSASTLQSWTGFSGSPSTSSTANTITVDQGSGLLVYSASLFSGSSSLLAYNDSFITNSTSSYTPLSYIISRDVFALAEVPSLKEAEKERLVLWASVADTNDLPIDLAKGPWVITGMQSATCSPACASGGVCSQAGRCLCAEGFTGPTCNQCQPGRFGPACTPCTSCEGGTCEDGITGTGRCVLPPMKPAAESCNCLNGICASGASECICNPGWADANGGQQCSVCETGFYLSNDGECLACGSGCTACAPITGTCSTCQPNLQPSQDRPQTCIPRQFLPSDGSTFTSCPSGTFLSSTADQTCSPCSAACGECFGPEANQCLSCSRGRGLLRDTCVSVDAATGICDGSAFDTTNAVAWVSNSATSVCDPLPPGCTAGRTPNFNTGSKRSDIQCTACLEGLVLDSHQCMKECPPGSLAVNSGGTPTCQACSSSCATCEGSSDFCLACPPGHLVVDGTCIAADSCPAGFFQANSSAPCTACHPDCATCSESPDKCTSCKSSRPVLTSDHTCVLTCALDEYLDKEGGTCSKCDISCGSCFAKGSGKCMSCTGNNVLKAGACVPANCDSMTPFGVCLRDLAVVQSKTTLDETVREEGKKLPAWVYGLIAVGVIILLGLLLLLWRLRNIKKRMEKTKGFQQKRGFFTFFRRGKKQLTENTDSETAKSTTIHLHNNVEFARSPTPPSYFSATSAIHPGLYKPPAPRSIADTASKYSFPKGPESRLWPEERNRATMDSESGMSSFSFEWPPARPVLANYEVPKSPFRPLLLRDSTNSSAASSQTASSSGKRFGTIDFSREMELQERQKALSKLTGSDIPY